MTLMEGFRGPDERMEVEGNVNMARNEWVR